MQNNPTSNGQGAGGLSNLTSGSAQAAGPSAAAASSNPLADGGGMFGAATTATETLGGRRQAGADGTGPPRKAMQLGKAKKLPNNLNLI